MDCQLLSQVAFLMGVLFTESGDVRVLGNLMEEKELVQDILVSNSVNLLELK